MESHNPGPIRSSLAILAIKLILVVMLADIGYALVFYLLTLQFAVPLDWHHHISVGLAALQLFKIIMEVALVVFVTLDWSNMVYEFSGQNLVIKHGFWRATEDIHELKHLRLAHIKQSLIGKFLGFGDIVLISSMPGSDQGKVVLYGVANPVRFDPIIKACLAQGSQQ